MSTPSPEELVDAFRALPADSKRLVLAEMLRTLVPPTFTPRWCPPHIDPSQEKEFRAYAAFELEGLWNAQSLGFMVEMIPLMYPYLTRLEGKKPALTCLDVGTRTGAGAALLARIFQAPFAVLRIMTDTIDVDPGFQDYQIARWPNIRRALIGDIFDLADASYDIVVCSHTIEHLDDLIPFSRKLARIARYFAFFYCPYDEIDPISGHFHVGDSLIDQLKPIEKRVIRSWWWRKASSPGMQDCVFFVLRGIEEEA